MKRHYLLAAFAALLSITSAAKAQTVDFTPGIKLGVNQPFYSETTPGISYSPGISVGLQSEVGFTPNHRLGVEVLYSTTNAKVNAFDISSTMSHLDIPIFYKHYINGGISLNGGLESSLLLNNRSKDNDSGDVIESTDGLNKYKASVLLGIGYITPTGFTFDTRYNIGVTNVPEEGSLRLSRFNFSVGWMF